MTEVALQQPANGDHRPRRRRVEIVCGTGLGVGIVAAYAFIGLTPSLLAHHGVLLEALAGTNAAIVSGGAFARVGRDSLLLVVLAPLCTVLLYDVFYWWAGNLWGDKLVGHYTRHNPRAARWLERAERLVRRHGIWTLAVAYYLPIPNFVVYVSCGTSGMPVWMFLLGDVIGLLLWEALLVGLGWAIGHPAVHLVGEIGHYSLWVTIGLIAAVIIVSAVRRRGSGNSPPVAADGVPRATPEGDVGDHSQDERMTLATELGIVGRGQPLALVVVPAAGVALAWSGGGRRVPTIDPGGVVQELADLDPRWTWWSAKTTAAPLVAAGVQLRTCWDLGAVGRLLHGLRRDDPAAIWAAEADLPAPDPPRETLDLFDVDELDAGPVRADGQLSREWALGRGTADLAGAQHWAALAIDLQRRQAVRLAALADPRAEPQQPALALLTAYAESAAALLAVELEHDGLPLDRDVATALLNGIIGERPTGVDDETARRRARDDEVRRHFAAADDVDLRSPTQVRELLARIGIDVPDTRSWRLEPHAATLPAVAALLAWRKADRTATTYGWRWLDTNVGPDGRLRGAWSAADSGSGRMTAMAGLHNLPAELRPAVRAEAGHRLIRADLGQVEPRVLAAISGDEALIRATHDADMYAPVAARLRCERATAKIAVLAAMYGQTSGPAGDTVRVMDQAYPQAMAYLRAAEAAGRDHTDLRTYGGRLLRLSGAALDGDGDPVTSEVAASHGRYARNAAVQGPAAELFKAWAATVRDGLAELDGRIVLCLHDELLVHVSTGGVDPAVTLLHQSLAATARWWAAGRPIRFIAEVATGSSWAAAHSPDS